MFASTDRKRNPLALLLAMAIVIGLVAGLTGHITPAKAAGTNYYVDSVNGNDGNSGTSSGSPWRSLNNVNNRSFGAGDTINLARGSSWTGGGGTSATLTINGGGAQGSPITITAYGSGAAPILRNPSSGNSDAIRVQAPWVTIQNLMLRDAHEAGVDVQADHTVIQNNEATQVGTLAWTESQYNLITRNYAHDLTMIVNDAGGGDNDYGADGVILHAGNNEVSYNRFINCKAPSIDFGTDGGGVDFWGNIDNTSIHHNYVNNSDGFIEVAGGSARNLTVAYNVLINTKSALGMHVNVPNIGSVVSNFRYYNNTFVELNDGYGLIWFDGSLSNPGDLIVRNNIFYANNFGILAQSYTPFTHDHNLYYFTGNQPNLNYGWGAGERVVDPMFVNVAGGADLHLRQGSPAIDAGVATLFGTDMGGAGVPAGNAVDIGAYEYAGTAPAPTPAPTKAPTATAAPTKAPTATAAPTKAPTATAAPTKAPTPTATPSQANLLNNGCFESGLTPWNLQQYSPAAATMAQDVGATNVSDHSNKVTITTADPSKSWAVQLRQGNLNIVTGKTYKISFYAKASAARQAQVVLQQMASPYTVYLNQTASVTTSWQQYSYTFTAGTSDTVYLTFNIGNSTPTLWLDHVYVTPM